MRAPESSQNLPPSLEGERYPAIVVLAASTHSSGPGAAHGHNDPLVPFFVGHAALLLVLSPLGAGHGDLRHSRTPAIEPPDSVELVGIEAGGYLKRHERGHFLEG